MAQREGLLGTLLRGRPNGLRARLRRMLGGATHDTSPAASYSAPRDDGGWGATTPTAAEPALGLQPEAPKDVTPPEGYEVVLHKDALAPGRVVEVIIAGTAVAVANVEGTFYAVSNSCPHADGPLGEGSLEGPLLTCPYHGWTFDVSDGSCKTNPDVKVRTFPVQVERDAVCVRV